MNRRIAGGFDAKIYEVFPPLSHAQAPTREPPLWCDCDAQIEGRTQIELEWHLAQQRKSLCREVNFGARPAGQRSAEKIVRVPAWIDTASAERCLASFG
jgi:hypothetical protein